MVQFFILHRAAERKKKSQFKRKRYNVKISRFQSEFPQKKEMPLAYSNMLYIHTMFH